MLIVVFMKKFIILSVTAIIAGVIFYGSGSVVALSTRDIQTAEKFGIVYIGIENNASFLAPMPLNIYINPIGMEKSIYTQTFLEGYLIPINILYNT